MSMNVLDIAVRELTVVVEFAGRKYCGKLPLLDEQAASWPVAACVMSMQVLDVAVRELTVVMEFAGRKYRGKVALVEERAVAGPAAAVKTASAPTIDAESAARLDLSPLRATARKVARLAATGMSMGDISRKLDLAYSTVYRHFVNLKALGANGGRRAPCAIPEREMPEERTSASKAKSAAALLAEELASKGVDLASLGIATREVLGMYADGLSPDEIGRKMGMTVSGVKYHLNKVRNLGAGNGSAKAGFRVDDKGRRLGYKIASVKLA